MSSVPESNHSNGQEISKAPTLAPEVGSHLGGIIESGGNVVNTEKQILQFEPQALDDKGVEEKRRLEALKAYQPDDKEAAQYAKDKAYDEAKRKAAEGQKAPAAAATEVVEPKPVDAAAATIPATEAVTTAASVGVENDSAATRATNEQPEKLKARMDDIRERKGKDIKQVSSSDLAELNKYDREHRSNEQKRASSVSYNDAKAARQTLEGGGYLTPSQQRNLDDYESVLQEDRENARSKTLNSLENNPLEKQAHLPQTPDEIIADIGAELNKNGAQLTPELGARLTQALDAETNGEFSKQPLLAQMLNTKDMSEEQKKAAALRLGEALKKFTPKDLKEVGDRLQSLLVMEAQGREAERNTIDLKHDVWDIKEFIAKNKGKLNPTFDTSLAPAEASKKRQKWVMAMQLLSGKKAAILQMDATKYALRQMYREDQNFIERKLNLKGPLSAFVRGVANKALGKLETKIYNANTSITDAEGRFRPSEQRSQKSKSMDLNFLIR